MPAYEGNPQQAIKCVLMFCEEYPDAEYKTTKKRAKGVLNIGDFCLRRGARKETQEIHNGRTMDEELFTGEMMTKRRWDAQRCTNEFQKVARHNPDGCDGAGPPH